MATTTKHDVKDLALAPEGVRRIEWADRQMPVLAAIRERFEADRPLEGYRIDDPFNNHPLFKTEEQARLEETMDGEVTAADLEETSLGWPAPPPEEPAVGEDTDSGLWSRSRDFDWGD